MCSIPCYLGLEDGVSYTVVLLDCGVGSTKPKLMVGYPVVGCEIGVDSAENQFFQYFCDDW